MTGTRVVVTGATGFIGRHVVSDLLDAGCAVTAIVRHPDAPLPPGARRVVIPTLDPTALPAVRTAVAGADAIVHLAGRAHQIRDRAADPLAEFRRANVETTRTLLAALEGSAVKRIVLLSTVAAAVGATEDRVGDDVVAAPATPYGVSKREMELLALEEAPRHGAAPILLRPPLVYGPGMKGNPLRLMGLVSGGRPVPVSVPAARRSAVFVGNLTRAVDLALHRPGVDSRPYFVTDGDAPTTLEFIEAMARALSVRPRVLRMPHALLRIGGRFGDALASLGPFPFTSYEVSRLAASLDVDGTRFWRDADAAPRFSMADGMMVTARWFRSRGS